MKNKGDIFRCQPIGIRSSYTWPAIFLTAVPASAAGGGSPPQASSFWFVLGVIVLLLVIFIGYLQQNRMVKRKTTELRRELFERQMAEKELLDSEQQLRQGSDPRATTPTPQGGGQGK